MNAGDSLPVDQHAIEIERNRRAWANKPILRKTYREFHALIAGKIDRSIPGAIVELGSGIGAIKEAIPDCVTTDLFPNPWLDKQENAYRLNMPDGTVSHLILFDVWHHLRYPGTALKEFHRVLAPGGRVIILDPAISWLGQLLYGLFHHEPIGRTTKLAWEAPADFSPEKTDYFAAQGMATRHFWWGQSRPRLTDWDIHTMFPILSFGYFATGGFSGPQIGGDRLYSALKQADRLAARFPGLFAARLLVVLVKK